MASNDSGIKGFLHDRLQDLRRPGTQRRILKGVLWLGLGSLLFVFGMAALVYIGVFGALPTSQELSNIRTHTASEVYSEDKVLLGRYFVENRVNANLDEISPYVVQALIATEDARFFEHSGIDVRAWLRVLVKSILLFDESAGGGSTLSQQLAKNLYPREEYVVFSILVSKMKETFIARRMEGVYDKEELLRLYLNTVPFGEEVYGIKVAAQRFFNKNPNDLRIEEAAVLIGMLKANTRYNPVRNPAQAQERRNVVLTQMKKYEAISARACDSLQHLPMKLDYQKESDRKGTAAYFKTQLRQQVERLLKDYRKPDGTAYDLYTDGLKIRTTINARMQRYAEQAVAETMPDVQDAFDESWKKGFPWEKTTVLKQAMEQSARYQTLKGKGLGEKAIQEVFDTPIEMTVFDSKAGTKTRKMSPLDSIKHHLSVVNAGLLAIDPQTGEIKAWVGGIDHQHFQYDHVLSRRQMGSTFKPIVFAEALNQGMRPCEYTPNVLSTYEEYRGWTPRNAGGDYTGAYSMEGALSRSINTVTVAVALRTGIDRIRSLAKDMGVGGDMPRNDPSIVLGSADASLYEMVQIYGALANRGKRPELYYLDRIETADGKLIVAPERPSPERFETVLDPLHANMVATMLKSTTDGGTASRLRGTYGLRGDIASKTGTTQNQSDGWFVGFNPAIVAAVWVGAESPQVHFRTMSAGQGSKTALPVWGTFMKRVQADPTLGDIKNARFPSLPDTMQALMQCPPLLEDLPLVFEGEDSYEEIAAFNALLEGLDGDQINLIMSEHPRGEGELLAAYTERITSVVSRTQVKDDRKARRKAFWDKVLFRE